MVDYSPKECLKRANNQLAINTDVADRYACLELRQCIEALAYRKLEAYKSRMPQDISSKEKWQPAKIIAVLTELEPYSELDSQMSIFEENSDGRLGKCVLSFNQKEITTKFINKRHHKLGSYLHTPTISERSIKVDSEKFHDYLVKLASELMEYSNATTYLTMASITSFDCKMCNQKIIRNTASLKKGCVVECFNQQCQAQHIITDENLVEYELYQAKVECDCKEIIYVPAHLIKENSHVKCPNCSTKYIFSKTWQVAKIA